MMGYESGPSGAFPLAYGESWKVCPYSQNHVVRSRKYGAHVQKCRESLLSKCTPETMPPLMSCRYDRRHHVYLPELEDHEEECSHMCYDPSLFTRQIQTSKDEEYQEKVKEIEEGFAAEEKSKKTKNAKARMDAEEKEQVSQNEGGRLSLLSSTSSQGNGRSQETTKLKLDDGSEDCKEEEDWGLQDNGRVWTYDPYRLETRDGKRMLLKVISGKTKSERRALYKAAQIKFGYVKATDVLPDCSLKPSAGDGILVTGNLQEPPAPILTDDEKFDLFKNRDITAMLRKNCLITNQLENVDSE